MTPQRKKYKQQQADIIAPMLQSIRKQLGYTQKQMAKELGVTLATLVHAENKTGSTDLAMLLAYADVAGEKVLVSHRAIGVHWTNMDGNVIKSEKLSPNP